PAIIAAERRFHRWWADGISASGMQGARRVLATWRSTRSAQRLSRTCMPTDGTPEALRRQRRYGQASAERRLRPLRRWPGVDARALETRQEDIIEHRRNDFLPCATGQDAMLWIVLTREWAGFADELVEARIQKPGQ